jgi:glycosyltransferase involved in cell wall biosynthesis
VTLVSVVTPTWDRTLLLQDRCIRSVVKQSWPEIEHVIVSDGPDDWTRLHLQNSGMMTDRGGWIIYDELPDHTEYLSVWGSRARNHALSLTHGQFIAYLDDDNAYHPIHIAALVDALQCNPDADFAYSQMKRYRKGVVVDIVGGDPPAYGQIDTSLIMHRAGIPERMGMWPSPMPAGVADAHAPDWVVVQSWMEAGAKWVHVPQVTVDYYLPLE